MGVFITPSNRSLLTVNGNNQGLLSVPNATAFPVGAIVYLNSLTQPPLACVVTENRDINQIRIKKIGDQGIGSDISTYLVANSASLTITSQLVPDPIQFYKF